MKIRIEQRMKGVKYSAPDDDIGISLAAIAECVQDINERLKRIEKWHNDMVGAKEESDEQGDHY